MSDYFRFKWAVAGETEEISVTTAAGGVVSFQEGWGEDYSLDLRTDPEARSIEREKFNYLINRITGAIQYLQVSSGIPEFITTVDNGGTPFSYAEGVRCWKDGVLYQSLVGSNTQTPPNTNWAIVDVLSQVVPNSITYDELAANGLSLGTYYNSNITLNSKGQITAISSGASPFGLLDGFESWSGGLPNTLPWASAQAAQIEESSLNVTQGTKSAFFNAVGAVTMTAASIGTTLAPFGELLVDVYVGTIGGGDRATITCGANSVSTANGATGAFTLRVAVPSGATSIALSVSGASQVWFDNLRYGVKVSIEQLANGSAYQVLQMNAGGTALEYVNSANILANAAADIPVNSKKITGVLDPTSNQDAATKVYVDNAVAAIPSTPAATQAEMEAGASSTTYVSPARQQFHPSSCKFWGKADVSGSINASYNVTSVTDDGVGQLTVTIATDFSSSNWAGWVSVERGSGSVGSSSNLIWAAIKNSTQAAGAISFECTNNSGYADPTRWHFGGFGDQS